MSDKQCVLTLHFKLDGISQDDLLELIGENSLDILSDVTHMLQQTLDISIEDMWPDGNIPKTPNLEDVELLYYFNVEEKTEEVM